DEVAVHPEVAKLAGTPVVLDNKCCRFEPHIATLWLKQPLKITNSDACGHNAACSPKKDEPFNPLLQPNTDVTINFQASQTLPQPVSCAIHPWMKGYVLPRANPYVTTTNAKGEFEIANLPAGQHQFQVWHERAGYLMANKEWVVGRKKGIVTVTIAGGKATDLGEVKVDPALLAPK
ncbi:MAG TPA: carboxypeptidase regulatory-like domain-containing protein, partial [Pirellulales bacterium]